VTNDRTLKNKKHIKFITLQQTPKTKKFIILVLSKMALTLDFSSLAPISSLPTYCPGEQITLKADS